MTDIINEMGHLASFIGSLTVVGSALIWIYNQFIAKPREKKREKEEAKRHKNTMEVITKENEPLNKAIKQLNEWLSESQADRKKLNEIAEKNIKTLEEHDERLDEHHGRLIRLETKTGIKYYSVERGED